uniref:NADAR family protein n=1 Tax=Thaumasiovibrio occultus TaxID=1891184 RepID=UPI00192D0DFD|nr:NADAR family protein [Thaumasiovibrio occultus]
MDIYSREALIDAYCHGTPMTFVKFWGHSCKPNAVTKACFSQWYHAPFLADGKQFQTAEHFMMYYKALLFGDHQSAEKVLLAPDPGVAKAIGRQVVGFDNDQWLRHRFDIVVEANRAKFLAHPELKAFLLATSDAVLVEASPVDRIWGIGLAEDDPRCDNPTLWRGENLLGFALMKVRTQLCE